MLVMIKAILYERTVALCARIEFASTLAGWLKYLCTKRLLMRS